MLDSGADNITAAKIRDAAKVVKSIRRVAVKPMNNPSRMNAANETTGISNMTVSNE